MKRKKRFPSKKAWVGIKSTWSIYQNEYFCQNFFDEFWKCLFALFNVILSILVVVDDVMKRPLIADLLGWRS